jgi:hypothetical protein
VQWRWLEQDADPDWDKTDRLFAFADPENDELLYIGAATGATLRERCEAADLEAVWHDLRGIGIEQVSVLVGTPTSPDGDTIGAATVTATAALLVADLLPTGNGDTADAPAVGLEIACDGDWPYEESQFGSS